MLCAGMPDKTKTHVRSTMLDRFRGTLSPPITSLDSTGLGRALALHNRAKHREGWELQDAQDASAHEAARLETQERNAGRAAMFYQRARLLLREDHSVLGELLRLCLDQVDNLLAETIFFAGNYEQSFGRIAQINYIHAVDAPAIPQTFEAARAQDKDPTAISQLYIGDHQLKQQALGQGSRHYGRALAFAPLRASLFGLLRFAVFTQSTSLAEALMLSRHGCFAEAKHYIAPEPYGAARPITGLKPCEEPPPSALIIPNPNDASTDASGDEASDNAFTRALKLNQSTAYYDYCAAGSDTLFHLRRHAYVAQVQYFAALASCPMPPRPYKSITEPTLHRYTAETQCFLSQQLRILHADSSALMAACADEDFAQEILSTADAYNAYGRRGLDDGFFPLTFSMCTPADHYLSHTIRQENNTYAAKAILDHAWTDAKMLIRDRCQAYARLNPQVTDAALGQFLDADFAQMEASMLSHAHEYKATRRTRAAIDATKVTVQQLLGVKIHPPRTATDPYVAAIQRRARIFDQTNSARADPKSPAPRWPLITFSQEPLGALSDTRDMLCKQLLGDPTLPQILLAKILHT